MLSAHRGGGCREGPGAEAALWHPPEAVAGNGDAGKLWRGQQHPDTAREVVAGCARVRCFVIWPVHSNTASLHAWIALHCLGQVRHRAFLLVPSHPLSAGPVSPLPRVLSETTLCPLLSLGQDLASLAAQEGKAELNRTKINPNNKATNCSRRRRVPGTTFDSEVRPR